MSDNRQRLRRVIAPLVVALVGLVAILLLEDLPTRHGIESKLADRSRQALLRDGIAGASVSFTGRDGAVVVKAAADVTRARSIVESQEGVRVATVTVAQPVVAAPTPAPVSPEPTPTPTPTPSTSTSAPSVDQVHGQIVAAGPVEFDTGSATLTEASHQVLAKIAAILQANPNMKIRIEGNTDSVGSASSNLALGKQRAHTVYNALKALGVSPDRMSTVGYGESHPQVPNTSESNRAINRRVSFTLSQ
jgi:outer membrane protein OmpA-like peptidoglycan-associated protein